MPILSLMPFLRERTQVEFDTISLRKQKLHVADTFKDLHDELLYQLGRPAVETCARKLGMTWKGMVTANHPDEITILLHYAVYHFRPCGKNIIDRVLEKSPPPEGSEDLKFMRAMAAARFSLFKVIERDEQRVGVRAEDMHGRPIFIADVCLSEVAEPGMVLAGGLVALPEFNVFAGVVVIVPHEVLTDIAAKFRRLDVCYVNGELTRQQESEVAAYVTRRALAAHWSKLER